MNNDITSFISWFVNQVISIFGSMFSILDSITFLGTSLFKFCLTILIIGSIISILITISKNRSVRSGRVRSKNSGNGGD